MLSYALAASVRAQEAELRAGQLVYGPQQSECTGSFLLDNVAELCKLFTGKPCASATGYCRTHTRQVFTGTRLGPASTAAKAEWNGMGGSGELMADALICLLRELSPQLKGAIRSSPLDISLAIGKVSVVQEVGFKEFRRVNPEWKGYRKVTLELPVVGKAEAVVQTLTVTKRSYASFGGPLLAGNRPITHLYALNVTAEDQQRILVIKPPSFIVATPIGPFSVNPEFSYTTRARVIAAPYGAPHLDIPNFLGTKNTVRFSDLFGIDPGTKQTTKSVGFHNVEQNRTGWLSQLGFGTRGTHADKAVWKAPVTGPSLRPDLDPYKPRSTLESEPTIYVLAAATLKYPDKPKDLLPSWVLGLSGLKADAYITVTPKIEVSVAGQLTLGAGEGSNYTPPTKEFSISAQRFASASLVSGLRTAASFTISVRLKIWADASFPIVGSVNIIDVDETFPVPISGDTKSSQVYSGGAVSTGSELPETLDGIRTLHGSNHPGAAGAAAFIQQCYAPQQPPPNEPKLEPAKPGNPKDLFAGMLWPCNICVASKEVKDKGKVVQPVHYDTLIKSTGLPPPGHWKCDYPTKSGCLDMCTWNPDTKVLTIARLPKQIASSLPANHPKKILFSQICDKDYIVR
jgi:hypothetical protein